ncbi:hypothetical protein Egran_06952 [Elaphomyces granulatus]|uniref:Uncharacterized protein n=1 Tax=Elaphomyces granulatus TaxID=519963 RepID=A0A232LM99_9EURO|nr:hypothetical protein Egran_06952 [Elaphomyces granulatus]
MIYHYRFRRGIPPSDFLRDNPIVTQFLREVLVSNQSEGDPLSNKALDICYRQGWLQAELLDPSDPNPKTYLISTSSLPFPSDKFPSVQELCFAVIREFKSSALKPPDGQRLGPGAVPRPVEARYQDEFYRACDALLGNIYLSSEWLGKDKIGRVDFLVKSQEWAIECIRDGDRLEEHISKFQEGGRYHKWIVSGEIKEHILLDFRKSGSLRTRNSQLKKIEGVLLSILSY